MIEFERKKKVKKIIYSKTMLVVLFIVLAFFVKALIGVYSKERISQQYLNSEKAELDKAALRKASLVSSIDSLKTDEGFEKEVRSKFRLVKEGENVAVIVDNDSATTSAGSGQLVAKKSWWKWLWPF